MTTENGSYVTRAELQAHLDPVNKKLDEIGKGVQVLLLERAGRKAVTKRRSRLNERTIALAALAASGFATAAAWFH